MTILDTREVSVREELHIRLHSGSGHRLLMWGESTISDDGEGTFYRCSKWAVEIGSLVEKKVAWVGGGFCVGPRIFGIANCNQYVYEIESSFAEFCPEGVEFIPGDYRDTLTGKFDVIVYDLGGEVPREFLSKHLNEGGVLLPKED
jgi:hypothetical protein